MNGKAIPKDLAIVGEIVDYKFVLLKISVGKDLRKIRKKDIKDYGNIAILQK
nr:hypothetical protein [Mycoplasmopsis bovis]